MKNFLSTITATTHELKEHTDILSCFLYSAQTLRSIGYDKACRGEVGGMNFGYNENLITSFFLYRHAIELAIKALIKKVQHIYVGGHNIKKLWENYVPNHQDIFPLTISKAFQVLEKFGVLKDAQLFRYHADISGERLESLPQIKNEDFEALYAAACDIEQHTCT